MTDAGAAITSLDLIISVDTAVLHLAAATAYQEGKYDETAELIGKAIANGPVFRTVAEQLKMLVERRQVLTS